MKGVSMDEHMISTTDNPFNPFTHFDEWKSWDEHNGYNTCAYLARVVITSDDLGEADQELAVEAAISEIVDENINGMYIRVTSGFMPRP
jgi:hypothetical protein